MGSIDRVIRVTLQHTPTMRHGRGGLELMWGSLILVSPHTGKVVYYDRPPIACDPVEEVVWNRGDHPFTDALLWYAGDRRTRLEAKQREYPKDDAADGNSDH